MVSARFSIGVNAGLRDGDAGRFREDARRIAALGFDTIRLIAGPGLPEAAASAAEAGLTLIPVLSNEDLNPVAALRAQPAVRAWDLGGALRARHRPSGRNVPAGEHASEPVEERALAAWMTRLAAAIHHASRVAVTASIPGDDLMDDRGIRLGTLCEPLAFASLEANSALQLVARTPLDPEVVPFAAMIAAAFSYKPVVISAFGAETGAGADEFERAVYAMQVLDRLHADGRSGAFWWAWDDLLDEDGKEKPVASALAAFARQRREVITASEMPMIAGTYYYRTLPESAHTLYEAYLGFVSERRAAAKPQR